MAKQGTNVDRSVSVSRALVSDAMMLTQQVSDIYLRKSWQNSLSEGSTKDEMKKQRPDLDSCLLGTGECSINIY